MCLQLTIQPLRGLEDTGSKDIQQIHLSLVVELPCLEVRASRRNIKLLESGSDRQPLANPRVWPKEVFLPI